MSAGHFLQWNDLFVVLDDGQIPVSRYDAIEAAMKDQAKKCPGGFACFVVLPKGATPPPQPVKERVKTLLTLLEPSLTALAYVIEDTGFKAVAARTALIAMKIFMPRKYPIYVETSMDAVLTKLLPHLKKAQTVTKDIAVIRAAIADARLGWQGGSTAQKGGAVQVAKS